jgi:cbb3-type cytochrome oxidase subunit 3
MGRRTTRGRRQEVNRPSTFFIVALAIGLILFFIALTIIVRRPQKKQQLGAMKSAPAALIAWPQKKTACSGWRVGPPTRYPLPTTRFAAT